MTAETDLMLLLTVTDRFQIDQRGIVLTPDFSVPGGNWSDKTHPVTVETPDGNRFDTEAVFGLSHFNIRDPKVSIDRRWRVTVRIPQILKDQVPIGSRLLASPLLVAILQPETKAEQNANGNPHQPLCLPCSI